MTMTAMPPSIEPGAKQRAAQARCDAMVRHARDQIMAVGVDRFSVNEVLRLSGGSKATLVKYFGDRTGLIAAAIGSQARETLASLALQVDAALPLQAALEQFLEGVLQFYLTSGALALYRAVVSAADPKGAEGFYQQGHQEVVATLAALLEGRKGSEVNPALDCADVADQLLHAIRAGLYEQSLIGMLTAPTPQLVKARVRATVALVLPALTSANRD
jgi:AcrR family transcriptional regulator